MKQKLIAFFRNRNVIGYIISIVVIAIISLAFFYPDAIEGNQLRQADTLQGLAVGHETKAYADSTGIHSRWTNSLFSGMPTFQISPSYPSNSLFSWLNSLMGLCLPSPSSLLAMMMLGFLILMMSMGIRWYYGLIGAIAWGFSSYFIIIIGAGHLWKFATLAYIPPTIAGVLLAYRGRYLWGAALAALFAMLQIFSNHIQMTYYFAMLILILVVAFLIVAIRTHSIRRWLIATASLAVAAILAVAANLPSLYSTYEYSKETIRGGHSELTSADSSDSSGEGLSRDYITAYSYGRSETFTLLIPNVKGGASAKPAKGEFTLLSLAQLPEVEEMVADGKISNETAYYLQYLSQYFGEPESTNGPVYVGAIIFALFLLGCIIVRGPLKWSLLIATILSILLSWGRNFIGLTDFFIDYVPMYNKFRTPESILVIAEFTMPLLAILALVRLFSTPKPFVTYRRQISISFGIPALFCIIGIIFPGFYGPAIDANTDQLLSALESQMAQAGIPASQSIPFLSSLTSTIETLRHSMIEADSLRSFCLITSALFIIILFTRGTFRRGWAVGIIGVLILADLYTVNKRYIDHESFCPPAISSADPFPMSDIDRAILSDTTSHYRVMDIKRFWDAAPSYHHRTIGGYHAAKLTRYQDLIERHLSHFSRVGYNPELRSDSLGLELTGGDRAALSMLRADLRILDMLNAKYIIDNNGTLAINPDALGNAWLVDSLVWVDTPDQEMDALSSINPAVTAVADRRFSSSLSTPSHPAAPTDTIYLTSYTPDRLTYHVDTRDGGLAVFSEVYFPWGWNVTIDGEQAPLARVNYLLRAVNVPAGPHTIVMTFDPQSLHATTAIARVAVILIYVLVLMAIAAYFTLRCPVKRLNDTSAESSTPSTDD